MLIAMLSLVEMLIAMLSLVELLIVMLSFVEILNLMDRQDESIEFLLNSTLKSILNL